MEKIPSQEFHKNVSDKDTDEKITQIQTPSFHPTIGRRCVWSWSIRCYTFQRVGVLLTLVLKQLWEAWGGLETHVSREHWFTVGFPLLASSFWQWLSANNPCDIDCLQAKSMQEPPSCEMVGRREWWRHILVEGQVQSSSLCPQCSQLGENLLDNANLHGLDVVIATDILLKKVAVGVKTQLRLPRCPVLCLLFITSLLARAFFCSVVSFPILDRFSLANLYWTDAWTNCLTCLHCYRCQGQSFWNLPPLGQSWWSLRLSGCLISKGNLDHTLRHVTWRSRWIHFTFRLRWFSGESILKHTLQGSNSSPQNWKVRNPASQLQLWWVPPENADLRP